MINPHEPNRDSGTSFHDLKAECTKCFGFCCIALYFSASEGFPMDKEAGTPCLNLQFDFNCCVHKNLRKQGLKGCSAYDCFGAGQKVAQVTYGGHDWRQIPKSAKQMFEVFLIMRQLHEMLWYLTEALTLEPARPIKTELSLMQSETVGITQLSPHYLIGLDLTAHRDKVNILLSHTSELVRNKVCGTEHTPFKPKSTSTTGPDLIGLDLRRKNLRGANLRGACLIAADLSGTDLSGADLIGADLRDTDLRGTNLINCIFLNQAQINTAKGDEHTKLPISLIHPNEWLK